MKAVQIKGRMAPRCRILTLARCRTRNLPLVVYPHGGPHARDNWGFDPVVQFLASRGYAVLQVNYRGPSVTARRGTSGPEKWGTVMVDDVNAATRWAIDEGIANPRAYASLAGISAAMRRSWARYAIQSCIAASRASLASRA